MNYRTLARVSSLMLAIIALGEFFSFIMGCLFGDEDSADRTLLYCALGTSIFPVTCACIVHFHHRSTVIRTGAKEGFLSVAAGWLVCTLASALPFVLATRKLPQKLWMSWPDAIFEAASGMTTTGATVITDVERMPVGLLCWRSFLNWMGGVGIVFFALLILPKLGVGEGKKLYNAEVPGLKTAGDQMTPRLSSTIRFILYVYMGLTFAACVLYWACGMPFHEALFHSFSTIATGGFSTRNASLAAFDSPALHWIATAFMLLAASNFSLVVKFFKTGKFSFFSDEEFRVFFCVFAIATLFITAVLWRNNPAGIASLDSNVSYPRGVESYLRVAALHVATVMSTTGFTLSDWNAWAAPSIKMLIFVLMFPCGCAGSTAGGMKYSRIIVLFKQLKYEVRRCISPHACPDIRLNGEHLDNDLVRKALAFALLYFFIFVLVSFILCLLPDYLTLNEAVSGTLTCLSNVGPGFGRFSTSFNNICGFGKVLLAVTMITGRLELYTMLVLFAPAFWKR